MIGYVVGLEKKTEQKVTIELTNSVIELTKDKGRHKKFNKEHSSKYEFSLMLPKYEFADDWKETREIQRSTDHHQYRS